MQQQSDVLIVGAGLAGLCCARRLHEADIPCEIYESSDGIGGRVRTDEVEGFLLDRGFQVFAAAYPEARRILDYEALELRSFYPGALIHFEGSFHRVADPWRRPFDAIRGIFSPIGTLADKLRVGSLRRRALSGTLEELFSRPEERTSAALRRHGFSASMIDRFFRPFFGGVFLERELRTSSRMMEFVFRMFAGGATSLPAGGMGRIPAQLAATMPSGTVHLNTPVEEVGPGVMTLRGGDRRYARAVVLAVEGPQAGGLLPDLETPAYLPAGCFYFAVERAPVQDPILVLDGHGAGPIQTLSVLNRVSPRYAPDGAALISVSVLGEDVTDPSAEARIRDQARSWFGPDTEGWRLLRVYRIAKALPDQSPPALARPRRPVRLSEGLYVCGDHRDQGSIQGAMASGRRAAEAIVDDFGRGGSETGG